MIPFISKLIPNKSYNIRRLEWLRFTYDGFRISGVLNIIEKKHENARINKRTYVVNETYDSQRKAPTREFVFIKDVFNPFSETYWLYYYPKDLKNRSHCTCKGFERHRRCVHSESILTLIDLGFVNGKGYALPNRSFRENEDELLPEPPIKKTSGKPSKPPKKPARKKRKK